MAWDDIAGGRKLRGSLQWDPCMIALMEHGTLPDPGFLGAIRVHAYGCSVTVLEMARKEYGQGLLRSWADVAQCGIAFTTLSDTC